MAQRFATGKKAIAECDICGFQYKLNTLRKLVINDDETNIKACTECWNADHPQNKLGKYPVDDPQAIRDPRPDFAGYEESRSMKVVVTGVTISASVGQTVVNT
jgi:hypothetical protein